MYRSNFIPQLSPQSLTAAAAAAMFCPSLYVCARGATRISKVIKMLALARHLDKSSIQMQQSERSASNLQRLGGPSCVGMLLCSLRSLSA